LRLPLILRRLNQSTEKVVHCINIKIGKEERKNREEKSSSKKKKKKEDKEKNNFLI